MILQLILFLSRIVFAFNCFRYFFPPAKVNIIRCDIPDSLMVSLIIIPTDKPGYFLFEFFRQLPNMQEYLFFHRTMVSFDLTIGLSPKVFSAPNGFSEFLPF